MKAPCTHTHKMGHMYSILVRSTDSVDDFSPISFLSLYQYLGASYISPNLLTLWTYKYQWQKRKTQKGRFACVSDSLAGTIVLFWLVKRLRGTRYPDVSATTSCVGCVGSLCLLDLLCHPHECLFYICGVLCTVSKKGIWSWSPNSCRTKQQDNSKHTRTQHKHHGTGCVLTCHYPSTQFCVALMHIKLLSDYLSGSLLHVLWSHETLILSKSNFSFKIVWVTASSLIT